MPFSTTNHTQLRLRVDGTWLGKGIGGDYSLPNGKVSNTAASQTTTATTGDLTGSDNKHNTLTFSPTLYWDDYGTADPDNIPEGKGGTVNDGSDGRTKGLTIYGVAVNDKNLPTATDERTDLSILTSDGFNNVAWNVGKLASGTVDQSTSGWENYDLLISNNIRPTDVNNGDGTYKFDDYVAKLANPSSTASDLLEFTHAMSKITVRLIAGDGFPTDATGTVGNTEKKFRTAPEVILTSNETGQSNAEWPFTSGTVNVTTGDVTGQGGPAKIKMHAQATPASTYTAIYDGLVVPGSEFGDANGDPAKYPIIARINADNNIYYVTSEAIRAKMLELNSSTDYKTESGKNYIITVTVNKTKIDVTATIKDWVDVVAEEVYPVINVNASYGDGGHSSTLAKDNFSFYRSTSLDNGYSNGLSTNINNYFAAEATVTKSGDNWSFDTPLYWSDHNTHYQMRGVWPLTTTDALADDGNPRVETSGNYQVIKVKNVKYEEGKFPSDLAIGRPDVATDATCNNSDHDHKNLYSDGICATEGTINLDFEYMMSKIEVNLSTTTGGDKVELEGAKVEVTNLYTEGEIRLGDRTAANLANNTLYGLHTTSTANQFMDAIVPQELTYSTDAAQKDNNVRFKITITNKDAVYYQTAEEYNAAKGTSLDDAAFDALSDEQKIKHPATKDVYYADVNPINKKDVTPAEKVAPEGKWKSGKYYKYYLKLSKTKIDVTAKLTDWVTVEASEDVWF